MCGPVPLISREQDFFLDLIFAPVETTASSSSKTDTEPETGTATEKEKEEETEATDTEDAAAAVGALDPARKEDDPSENNADAVTPDGATGAAEAGVEAENSAVARSESGGLRVSRRCCT